MAEINKILVPTDFSEGSLGALYHAATIAKTFDASIILIHIVESYSQNTTLKDLGLDYSDILKKGIEQKLSELAKSHNSLNNLQIKTKIEEGKVHRVIRKMVDELNIDLVVMGTHGATGVSEIDKFVLGSNAYRTVNASKVPVLTIRNTDRNVKINKILLPIDLTKSTEMKVGAAIEWGKKFNAKIEILAVSEFFDEFNPKIDRLPEQLDQIGRKLTYEGIENNTAYIENRDIAAAVIEYSNEVKADLIIIMTRQETLLNEWILGSHARRIVTHSEIPVLSIRPVK
jgi:nucleotide-binding universal stress UspA family protein